MNEETIFAAALEKHDPAARAAYLDEACAGDPGLRRRVEALLQSHEEAGGFLEQPALEQQATPSGEGGATQTGPSGGDDLSLDFLSPPRRPGALGRLGNYEVREVVGRGGMGVVLKAFDEALQRVVAIKVMAPQLAATASARKRFQREAQAAAAVRDEHVVGVHAVDEAGGLPYLVMEYVNGISLQQRLDGSGPLELKEILRIGMQTAAGLAAAHKQGLIHRDIKPANILLENGVQRVKITDFGLARAVDDASLTQSGVVAGTPQYMAPEQARGESVDHRADLFSLGSVLYALCTGHPPFRAGTTLAVLQRVSQDTPRPIREINPDIPEWLAAVIEKLHAKDPAARFQTAREVADVLGQHLAHLQQPMPAPAPRPLAAPAHRTRRRRAAAAAALLALVGLGATEATGVTHVAEYVATVLRIRTPEGTLVVEVNDPQVKVSIDGDGDEIAITGAGPQEVRLRPGQYRVRASKDGVPLPLDTDLVTITRGGKQVVKVSREPGAAGASLIGQWKTSTAPEMALQALTMNFLDSGEFQMSGLYEIEGRPVVVKIDGKERNVQAIANGVWERKGDQLRITITQTNQPGFTFTKPLTYWVLEITDRRLLLETEGKKIALFRVAGVRPPGAASRGRRFAPPKDIPITLDGVTATADGWKIENTTFEDRTVRLFEVRDLDIKDCCLVFRAMMKTETGEKLKNQQVWTRLEMVVRMDTYGTDARSDLPRIGNTSWLQEEAATVRLTEKAKVVALNLVVSGIGTVWIKDVELEVVPLK